MLFLNYGFKTALHRHFLWFVLQSDSVFQVLSFILQQMSKVSITHYHLAFDLVANFWLQWVVQSSPVCCLSIVHQSAQYSTPDCAVLSSLSNMQHLVAVCSSAVCCLSRVASGVRKINDYQLLSPHYRLIIDFFILFWLILSTFLFSGYLALI